MSGVPGALTSSAEPAEDARRSGRGASGGRLANRLGHPVQELLEDLGERLGVVEVAGVSGVRDDGVFGQPLALRPGPGGRADVADVVKFAVDQEGGYRQSVGRV